MRDSEAVEKARRGLGEQLAAYRRAAGYSQAALASLVAYSRSTVANVETGRQHVPRDFWERADAALHTGGTLRRASDEVDATARREREQHAAALRRARTDMGRQWQVTAEGSRTAARAAPPEAAAPALVAEASVPGVGAELPGELELIELGRRSEAWGLGSGTVDALWVAVDRLCRLYPTVLAPALRHQARQYLRYAVGLLGGRTTLAEHRDLLVQAGWLAALLACVSYDAGDAAEAEIARRMTAKLGEQAGHGELVAWSFEIAAWFALVEGRFPETVALSEAGAARSGATNAGVQLTLQAARGYARMHDSRAHGALEAGRALLDRLPEPGHPEHHFVFDRDKYEFYVATIYTWLGTDDAAATENAVEVVTRCRNPDGSTRWPTRLSTTRVNLGLIAGRRGDLDEAVSLGIDALGCARRSAELIPRALELQRQLATQYPRERLVTEYQERLAEEISGDKTRAT